MSAHYLASLSCKMLYHRARALVFLFYILVFFSGSLFSQEQSVTWQHIAQQAQGQTVYFYSWGGSRAVNDYIKWATREVKKQHQIKLIHVKVDDIATVITRLLAEQRAQYTSTSSADLLWVNGENFKRLKQNDLLFGPFSQNLPNMAYINDQLPILKDFGEPVAAMEAPWGVAQFHFIYNAKDTTTPPTTAKELLAYTQSKSHRQRVTYPKIPDFQGSSFLKQLLLELVADPAVLYHPVNPSEFDKMTAPLWTYLDRLHPQLWQQGKAFARNAAHTRQMLNDQELTLAMSFNPLAVQHDIARNKLPKQARAYAMKMGALTNVHFLAILKKSAAKAGAQTVINFLLSARAQAKKADPKVWGDLSVLDPEKLSLAESALFSGKSLVFKPLPEPHVSWHEALEKAWLQRYAG